MVTIVMPGRSGWVLNTFWISDILDYSAAVSCVYMLYGTLLVETEMDSASCFLLLSLLQAAGKQQK